MVRVTKLKLHRTIADIMRNSDLDKLTTKKIRMMCEKKYKIDLTDSRNSKLKSEIDDIVLKFVRKKSKEDDKDPRGSKDESPSSDNSDEVSGDEDESSSSGSESCSECSYSESSEDEANRKVPAKEVSAKASTSSKQPVASTSSKKPATTIVKKPVAAVSSGSKQPVAVPSTSKLPVPSVIPMKRPLRNVIAPPKKRMTSQSMNAAADDVAAIAAAAAAAAAAATTATTAMATEAPKKPKSPDVNNKPNVAAPAAAAAAAAASATPVVPCKKRSPTNNSNNDANNGTEIDDAAYARQLQAEEWNFRKNTVNKLFRSTPQKKVVKSDQAKKKKACPFLKKCSLSPALAEVLGSNEMSRPDIVQKMWSVVRERNLFDPANKQFIICDEQLGNVFGKKRIRLIGMMKYLKQHIKDVNRQ